MGKRYPLKAVCTLKKEKKGEAVLQTEPTWEHKVLSGTSSVLCARCKSVLWKAPEKGAYQPEERLAKEWNMESTQVHWI